ncbi:hypothetical protein Cob_v005058 [Colletotrichum orbiculare MAFF 240422]|uniref:Uncharacterized protein n=1 Tax=Colletotrichum orbiculare (strain 104-T / ATCC 96160 / CBS 514.97 / LARS 414 / MAFF 240422) TaxID=1213857 RepID=A0A484FWQ6_COLOR|nr:hypothetical protein Cob_v005058 [Colletotrichum orbiculare MAFF 240422]
MLSPGSFNQVPKPILVLGLCLGGCGLLRRTYYGIATTAPARPTIQHSAHSHSTAQFFVPLPCQQVFKCPGLQRTL